MSKEQTARKPYLRGLLSVQCKKGYTAGPIAIQAITVSVVSVLVKITSHPSLVLFNVPTPSTF